MMSERIRVAAGLVIGAIGAALVPLGWYFSRMLWIAAFVLFIVGLILMLTDRVLKSEHEIETTSSAYAPPVRPSVPGDIHNYSGWRDGGRSLGGDSAGDADD
jgi:tellurite resistance protein TehA-like permease